MSQPQDTKVVPDDQNKGKYALYFRGAVRVRGLSKAEADKLAAERVKSLGG